MAFWSGNHGNSATHGRRTTPWGERASDATTVYRAIVTDPAEPGEFELPLDVTIVSRDATSVVLESPVQLEPRLSLQLSTSGDPGTTVDLLVIERVEVATNGEYHIHCVNDAPAIADDSRQPDVTREDPAGDVLAIWRKSNVAPPPAEPEQPVEGPTMITHLDTGHTPAADSVRATLTSIEREKTLVTEQRDQFDREARLLDERLDRLRALEQSLRQFIDAEAAQPGVDDRDGWSRAGELGA